MRLTKKVTQVSIVVALITVFVMMVCIALAAVHYVIALRSGDKGSLPVPLAIGVYGSATVVCVSSALATLTGTLYLLAKRRFRQQLK